MTFSQDIKTVYASPTVQAAICHDALRRHMFAEATGGRKPVIVLGASEAGGEAQRVMARRERDAWRERVMGMRLAGMSHRAIAKKIARSPSFVFRVIHEAGA